MFNTIFLYFAIFLSVPILLKSCLNIDPYARTGNFVNCQAFNDSIHVFVLTAMFVSNNVKMIPNCTIVYFSMDIFFNASMFRTNQLYFVHHVSTILVTVVVKIFFTKEVELFNCHLYIMESALLPIAVVEILKMKFQIVPKFLMKMRAFWYFITRLYTYFFLFCFGNVFLIVLCIPLMVHNFCVFQRQLRTIWR